MLRVAGQRRKSGVRVIYCGSFTRTRTEYAVQHVRTRGQRRWACACPGYFHTWSVRRRHCKHILLVRRWLAEIGGLRKARPGLTATVDVRMDVQLRLAFAEEP